MRNCTEVWCEIADISVNEIDRRALREVEAGNFPTLIFISLDLLAVLDKETQSYLPHRYAVPGSKIMSIVTSAGSLNVKPVRRLRNFLLIGRLEDFEVMEKTGFDPLLWNEDEHKRVNQAFEDLVMLEGKE